MAYSVTLEKGKNNMIGISIGGGAPFCPVVYIVQVPKQCLPSLSWFNRPLPSPPSSSSSSPSSSLQGVSSHSCLCGWLTVSRR